MQKARAYRHYILIDSRGRVVYGWSSGSNGMYHNSDGILISSDAGFQFSIGGAENPQIFDDYGIPLFKWDGTNVLPRTEAEISADRDAIPPAPPSRMSEIERRQKNADAAIRSIMLTLSKFKLPGGKG